MRKLRWPKAQRKTDPKNLVLRCKGQLYLYDFATTVACASHATIGSCLQEVAGTSHSPDSLSQINYRLRDRYGAFIEVVNFPVSPRVQFIHQTVKEFVSRPGFPQYILRTSHRIVPDNGHTFLSRFYISSLVSLRSETVVSDRKVRSIWEGFADHAYDAETSTGVCQTRFSRRDGPRSSGICRSSFAQTLSARRYQLRYNCGCRCKSPSLREGEDIVESQCQLEPGYTFAPLRGQIRQIFARRLHLQHLQATEYRKLGENNGDSPEGGRKHGGGLQRQHRLRRALRIVGFLQKHENTTPVPHVQNH